MGLKRSRSCDDHDDPLRSTHKIRRAAYLSSSCTRRSLSHIDLANISSLIQGSRDGNALEVHGCTSPRDGHKVVEIVESHPQREGESNLLETVATPVFDWIEALPKAAAEFDVMSQTSFKRPRSNSDTSTPSSNNESSNEAKRSHGDLYKDPRYDALMDSKGAFMGVSEAGPLPSEIVYCEGLLYSEEDVELKDPILDGEFLQLYVDLMLRSSELRLCIDLHARLVPSAEVMSLQKGKIGDLREGCNDRWLQAIEFIPKLPQPDRTVAFRASVFTDIEKQKLRFEPGCKSLYTACEGMLFPFFTCEVKAGSEGLATARRANTNSMAVALRGIVDLFRRAKIEQDVHRKIMGITIAHNASTVDLYCHYPEINGQKTSYYQYRLRAFDYGDRGGQDRYTCYKFVCNIYQKFAERHLKRIREAIDKLEIPLQPGIPADPDREASLLTPTASDAGAVPMVPAAPLGKGLNQKAQIAMLTQNVNHLVKQMEQQRQQFEQQKLQMEQRGLQSEKQLEQQRQQMEQQRLQSEKQLEQQRQQMEQQRLQSEKQQQEAKEREANLIRLLSDRASER